MSTPSERAVALIAGSSIAMAAATCGGQPPDPPTAVIRSDPASICRGDAFATEIHFDATGSAAALTLVPVPPDPEAAALSFIWSFTGAAHEIVDGTLVTPEIRVTSAGDRPLHATLQVTSSAGGNATSLTSVPITVPAFRACADGCGPGERCVGSHLGEVCVPDAPCEFNVDCPTCSACDLNLQICVPMQGVQ